MVEVNRRNLALVTHNQRILGTNAEMLRILVVAILVVFKFTGEGIKCTEVGPADVARDNLHLVGLFHHGIVDGVGRDGQHVVHVHANQRIAIFLFGRSESPLCRSINFGRITVEFVEEHRCLETENTAVPEEASGFHIFLRRFQIGLFDKALHIFAIGFDITVTGFRAGRRDAEGHQETLLGKRFCLVEAFFVGIGLADHVVRRRHEHNSIRLEAEASKRNCGCRIATHRFKHKAGFLGADFF